jgi:hypothetical protein
LKSFALHGVGFSRRRRYDKLQKNTKGTDMEKRQPDPEKMKILRSLPLNIKQSLTKEEVDAFLYEEVWPDSLQEKLKDYLVD